MTIYYGKGGKVTLTTAFPAIKSRTRSKNRNKNLFLAYKTNNETRQMSDETTKPKKNLEMIK